MMGSKTRAFFLSVALVAGLTANARADEPITIDTCANAAEESQALRRDGKLTQARRALMTCSRAECPTFVRKDCTGWLADVERNLPSVVVRAVDATGKDLTKVRVVVDGVVVAETLDGRPFNIDPGAHEITYETEGSTPVTDKVLIRQGETNRLLSATFTAAATPAVIAPPPPKERDTPEKKSSVPLTSWILGGTGLVLGGVGIAMWASGKSDHSSLESGCAVTRSCAQSDVDSAQTKLLVGDIAIGAGLVAIGAAVVLALISKDAPSQKAMARLGLTLSP